MKLLTRAAVVAVLCAGLVGCSGGKKDDEAKGEAKSGEESSQGEDAPAEDVPEDLMMKPPRLKGAVAANADFKLEDCDLKSGPVVASGVLKPSGKGKSDYVITVTWTRGGKPVARSSATVQDAKPGQKAGFQIQGTLSETADDCQAEARKGTLKS